MESSAWPPNGPVELRVPYQSHRNIHAVPGTTYDIVPLVQSEGQITVRPDPLSVVRIPSNRISNKAWGRGSGDRT